MAFLLKTNDKHSHLYLKIILNQRMLRIDRIRTYAERLGLAMYKVAALAVLAGISFGTAAGFSFGSKELAGMIAGVAALALIAVPAAVVYANDKKKYGHAVK